MPRTVENWIEVIQAKTDDGQIASQLLGDLTHYRNGGNHEIDDAIQVLNLITAIRLLAAAKE